MKVLLPIICCCFIVACAEHVPSRHMSHRTGEKGTASIERPQTMLSNLDWDLKVGVKAYDETLLGLEQSGVPVDHEKDSAMEKRLEKIMIRLKDKTLLPSLPYEVHLIDHETANAACYPGGKIVFFSGIFDLHRDGFVDPKDEDEIAAVMAHEMAHGALRHSYLGFKTYGSAMILRSLLAVAGGYLGGDDWANITFIAFNVIAGIYFPKYSRDHESQADLESIYLMIAAGFRPEAILDIWERAYKRGGSNAKRTGVYSSHPSNRRRLELLTKQIALVKEAMARAN